jgi:hypothetical protein
MHRIGLILLAVTPVFSQALVEHAAAAAGGASGAVAGKKVSDGIDKVFGRVGQSLDKAAKPDKNAPVLKVGPTQAAPKPAPVPVADLAASPASAPSGAHRVESRPGAPVAPAVVPDVTASLEPAPAVAPAPQITADDVAKITEGVKREEVLARLGTPASKIMMFEDGKVLEIYRYANRDQSLGAVRLLDGAVTSVVLSQRQ